MKRSQAFKVIMGYFKKNCCQFILGIFFLVGGACSDLSVPYYIGLVIDRLAEEKYDEVGWLCAQLIIIVAVSLNNSNLV
jgi:ABC-type multidrug transport system fused ATPase/permease subunit